MSLREYTGLRWYLLASVGPEGTSYTHRAAKKQWLDDILTVCKNGRAKYAVLCANDIEKVLVVRIADIHHEYARTHYDDDFRLTPIGEYRSVHEAVMATVLLYEH